MTKGTGTEDTPEEGTGTGENLAEGTGGAMAEGSGTQNRVPVQVHGRQDTPGRGHPGRGNRHTEDILAEGIGIQETS